MLILARATRVLLALRIQNLLVKPVNHWTSIHAFVAQPTVCNCVRWLYTRRSCRGQVSRFTLLFSLSISNNEHAYISARASGDGSYRSVPMVRCMHAELNKYPLCTLRYCDLCTARRCELPASRPPETRCFLRAGNHAVVLCSALRRTKEERGPGFYAIDRRTSHHR